MEIIEREIDELKVYENNARTHSEEQIEEMVKSIKTFGFNDPIEVGDDLTIISGHCRLIAARRAGLTRVPTISHKHLSKTARKGYILAANKIAQNAGWDAVLLKNEFNDLKAEDFDLSLTGFSQEEIDAYLNPEELTVGLVDEDECGEAPEIPKTKLGDVWILGQHRVMCGDATSDSDTYVCTEGKQVDMVFTDPPYNTGMTPKTQAKTKHLSGMFNDSYTDEEWQEFMAGFMNSYWTLMKENSVAYICLDWRRNHELIPHIDRTGLKRSNLIVWDKMVHGLGSDYKYTYEFINVCKKGKPKLKTNQGDDREYSDVWHIQRKMGKDEEHATKKPVELPERCIRHASKPNDVVLDLFGGSGTTLIACEKLGRKCYMMELDPKYCDVIVKRWEKFTGKQATLESTGETYAET